VTAICEYLEEVYPQPVLIGSTAEERAITRMWTRRIDLHVVEPMLNGFRAAEGFEIFKNRLRLLPQAADDLKTLAQERIAWLDGLMERLASAGVAHERTSTPVFADAVGFTDLSGNNMFFGVPRVRAPATKGLPGRIQHVVVATRDAAGMVDFYTRVVGLTEPQRCSRTPAWAACSGWPNARMWTSSSTPATPAVRGS
jgi:hypothetical protein